MFAVVLMSLWPSYDVSDGDGVALKVDGVPSQAQGLAAPQSVERGDLK